MKSNNSVFQKAPYGRWKIFENARYYLFTIPKRIWDRATKGYCTRDLWNLDNFYCTLFYESIAEFKNGMQGHPIELTPDEWDSILSTMSALFKRIEDLENDDSYYDEETGKINKELALKIDEEMISAKDKAFDLMKKYFFNLWD